MTVMLAIHTKVISPGDQLIWRCDNEAAVIDFNRSRVRSAPMLAASKCVCRVVRQHSLKIHALHIAGDKNTNTDLLSRRRVIEAQELAVRHFGDRATLPCFPANFQGWTEAVIEAGYRSANKKRPVLA